MKRLAPILSFFLVATLAAGCATTQVTPDNTGAPPRVAKPGRIIVYNFAATAADLSPGDNAGDWSDPGTPTSAQVLATGRQLGALVAERLVEEINDMGMTAVLGQGAAPARPGDLLIEGHFESIDEGSATKRMLVGFGSGKAELRTVVVAYVVTDSGLRRVGGGTVDSGGGKGPGLFVPVIVTAATANPIGLVVAGAAKIEGQATGRTTIEGSAKRTADAIAERMKERFEQEGWI